MTIATYAQSMGTQCTQDGQKRSNVVLSQYMLGYSLHTFTDVLRIDERITLDPHQRKSAVYGSTVQRRMIVRC